MNPTPTLTGSHWIAGRSVHRQTGSHFFGVVPATGIALSPAYTDATPQDIDEALGAARMAFDAGALRNPNAVRTLLHRIADEIVALGDDLIDRAIAETALSRPRLLGERGRTVGQLRMFADLVGEGSWVDARIDLADPARTPAPKPDVRRLLVPIGPIVVFGASNFPLAFSVAGGDTASALAAGNPVVVKAHPSHPGTSELVGCAIVRALDTCGMNPGIFSMLHGISHDVGLQLTRHPLTQAVGFTGSLIAGRSLAEAAARREIPITVYAEMGSINPVLLLPGAVRERGAAIARGLSDSVLLAVGQFCTNPGVAVGIAGDAFDALAADVINFVTAAPSGAMLYAAIGEKFEQCAASLANCAGVRAHRAKAGPDPRVTSGVVLVTSGESFIQTRLLQEECFGPLTVLVACRNEAEMRVVAQSLSGQLTASLHATAEDLAANQPLLQILQEKAGRVIFNQFPTGVEVCPSMHHGGPYPATADAHFTSVGTAAIERFTRPLCFQNFPNEALPPALQNSNPLQIWRLVNNQQTRETIVDSVCT